MSGRREDYPHESQGQDNTFIASQYNFINCTFRDSAFNGEKSEKECIAPHSGVEMSIGAGCGSVTLSNDAPKASVDKENALACFKILLTRKVKEVIGCRSALPLTSPPRIAQLQLCQEDEEDFSHFITRQELIDIFNKPPKGNIKLNEVFTKAEEHARDHVKKRCTNGQAYEMQLCVHKNMVWFTGPAGIGKTTLVGILAEEAIDKNWFDVEWVFYIRFRDVDFEAKMSFLDFLLCSCKSFCSRRKGNNRVILEHIENNPNVLLIMDGWDEANMESKLKDRVRSISVHDEATADVFIINLFRGDILTNSKKAVTSRPKQLRELPDDCKPWFLVRVLGLNQDAQEQICEDICSDSKPQVLEFLQENPSISSYCYVPINCILILSVLLMTFVENHVEKTKQVLRTMTSILVYSIKWFIKVGHLRGKADVKKIAKVAWKGVKRKQYTFTDTEMRRIANSNQGAFFRIGVGSKIHFKFLEGEGRTYFSHLLLQEFFASLKLLMMDDDKFQKEMTKFNESKFEMVSKFLFGLCNPVVFNQVIELLPCDAFALRESLECKKEALRKFAHDTLKNAYQDDYFHTFLRISSWAYEMQDGAFSTEIANAPEKELVVLGTIHSSDIPTMQLVLYAREEPLNLHVGSKKRSVKFVGDSLERFLKTLVPILEKGRVKLKSFSLSSHKLNDDVMALLVACLRSVKELHLTDCDITDEKAKHLFDIIKSSPTPLQVLNLSQNPISDASSDQLTQSIGNINELLLCGCKITAKTVICLSKAIEVFRFSMQMRKLDLSYNQLTDDVARALPCLVDHCSFLYLAHCSLSLESIKSLCNAISRRRHRLEGLCLTANNIDEESVIALAKCIDKIKDLEIDDKHITRENLKKIAENCA